MDKIDNIIKTIKSLMLSYESKKYQAIEDEQWLEVAKIDIKLETFESILMFIYIERQ